MRRPANTIGDDTWPARDDERTPECNDHRTACVRKHANIQTLGDSRSRERLFQEDDYRPAWAGVVFKYSRYDGTGDRMKTSQVPSIWSNTSSFTGRVGLCVFLVFSFCHCRCISLSFFDINVHSKWHENVSLS